jgi:putative FmdB family regulatory protein
MPVYDYLCGRCGPFTEMRPMAECELPFACPVCGKNAPRAFLTVPYFATMSSERRLAHAKNERSASAPRALSDLKKTHGSGCSCCSGKSLRPDNRKGGDTDRTASKSYPTRRPWMLSH